MIKKVLIIDANYYKDLANELVRGAVNELDKISTFQIFQTITLNTHIRSILKQEAYSNNANHKPNENHIDEI